MSVPAKQFYDFSPFRLDVAEGVLLREGKPVSITPKAFQLLRLLVDNHGHILSKDDLLRQVWPDTFVEEGNLPFNISQLRKALGQTDDGITYIETIPKRGYRFAAPVTVVNGGALPAPVGAQAAPQPPQEPVPQKPAAVDKRPLRALIERRPLALALVVLGASFLAVSLGVLRKRLPWSHSSSAQIQSIAVLPFENLSRDPGQDYFADGVTEELITDLAKISSLRVISRTSVMRYKGTKKALEEIARELNVDTVVEGAVRSSGGRVHITAQLVQPRPEKHLWAESYERDIEDVLGLQNDVARDIANQIRVKLTPEEVVGLEASQPVRREAYEAYLKSRYFLHNEWGVTGARKSIEYSLRAVGLDPTFALAYAGLAESYLSPLFTGGGPVGEAMPQAEAAAQKAVQLDSSLAAAHVSLGLIRLIYTWDWRDCERELMRALQLAPNDPDAHWAYGWYLGTMGRLGPAIAEMRRARELDPLSFVVNRDLGISLYHARRYDEAIDRFQRAIELNPARGYRWLGWAHEDKGLNDQAVQMFLKDDEVTGATSETIGALRKAYAAFGMPGWLKASLKLEAWPDYEKPYFSAQTYARLGDRDNAFRWLEKAYNQRSVYITLIEVDPALDNLRSDTRYADLLRRMGLPLN